MRDIPNPFTRKSWVSRFIAYYSKPSCGGVPSDVTSERHDDGKTINNDASGNCGDGSDIDRDSHNDIRDKSDDVCDDDANLNDGEGKTFSRDSGCDGGNEFDASREKKRFAINPASGAADELKRARRLSLRLVLDAKHAGGPFGESASRLRQLTCSRDKPKRISAKTIDAATEIISIEDITDIFTPAVIRSCMRKLFAYQTK
ncbi:hypothetical protein DVH05_015665 [Phytophthora capsici]|nr:hypothetical protein DVH05_015665 [Phytophthora capsici]